MHTLDEINQHFGVRGAHKTHSSNLMQGRAHKILLPYSQRALDAACAPEIFSIFGSCKLVCSPHFRAEFTATLILRDFIFLQINFDL